MITDGQQMNERNDDINPKALNSAGIHGPKGFCWLSDNKGKLTVELRQ